jgi:carbon starvation protein CstA
MASILIWLMQHDRKKYLWIPLIPLMFYSFVTCSYLMEAKIGFSLPYGISLIIGLSFAILVAALSIYRGNKKTLKN